MSARKLPKPAAKRGGGAGKGPVTKESARSHRGGPDVRAEAMKLLGEGYQLASVARIVGVSRVSVRDWRDSPEGARQYAAARADRKAFVDGSIGETRQTLKEAGPLAARILVDGLYSEVPFEAQAAAVAILDRIGVPRTTVVDASQKPSIDTSKFTDAELDEYERLRAKGRADGGRSP